MWATLLLMGLFALVYALSLLLPSHSPGAWLGVGAGMPGFSARTVLLAPLMHYGPLHLAVNLVTAWFIGCVLEQRVGHVRLLLFALAAGAGASLAYAFVTPRSTDYGGGSIVLFALLGYLCVLLLCDPAYRRECLPALRPGTWRGNWLIGYVVLGNVPLLPFMDAGTLALHGVSLCVGLVLALALTGLELVRARRAAGGYDPVLRAPRIDTARLCLRPHAPADYDRFYALLTDPVAKRFTGGVTALSKADRRKVYDADIAAPFSESGAEFAIVERLTGRYAGYVGFRLPVFPSGALDGAELYYGLTGDMVGRGYGGEAVAAALSYFFRAYRHGAYYATVDPANAPSQRLLQKLGAAYAFTDDNGCAVYAARRKGFAKTIKT